MTLRRPDLEPQAAVSRKFAESVRELRVPVGSSAIWSLGGSGILFKDSQVTGVIDPYLTNRLGELEPDAPAGWRDRNAPPPVAAADLDFLDVILITHGHGDHLDPWTIAPLASVNPSVLVVAPRALRDSLMECDISADRILHPAVDAPSEAGGLRFTALPAAHLPAEAPVPQPDAEGEYAFLSYLLDLEGARVFHAGDTVVYEGLVDRLENRVDVAVLPVNGRRWAPLQPMRRGNMEAEEAVDLAGLVGAATLVPVHYQLLGSSASSLDAVRAYSERMHPALRLLVMQPGDCLVLPATRAERLERLVRTYFDACNEADVAKFRRVLAPGVIHYFPPNAGGPYVGADAVIELWTTFVANEGSVWTIDRMVSNDSTVVIEWTHFKPRSGTHIRGSEWYAFDEADQIVEIRAHYASPRDQTRPANELQGFDYAKRGYPVEAPRVRDQKSIGG